jgi:hypothetical protein
MYKEERRKTNLKERKGHMSTKGTNSKMGDLKVRMARQITRT